MPPEPPPHPAAFTVLPPAPAAPPAPPPRVNVVKPMQHDDLSPNTILDPKFSRALDLKLRRLKEKEVLQANLRRAPRARRGRALAASEPELSGARGGARARPRREAPAPAERPRFVTTVRAGRFLLPPPEIACLLGLDTLYPAPERERLVYSYASKPKAVPRGREPGPARSATRPAPHQGPEPAPRGAPPVPGGAPRAPSRGPGALFSGMRSLMAGVVGMTHMLDKSPTGSVAPYNNVMHDKRVVRGSTFGAHPHAAGDGLESAAGRAARTRRRALARRAAAARLRPGTPPPAPGRRHHPIQTEYYLEELFDKGAEYEVGVQTDLFADRPATPPYVPAKTGADAATQIYPGDLFDFDLEAQPVLDALVGKTCEQALAEAAQEEELETLREQQRRYCELRDAERAERARLAAQHARLHREKERRVAQARGAQAAARGARERAAAAALVQGYVAELLPAVLAGLRDQGYLLERVHRGVDEEFMPWLAGEVAHEMETILTSRDVITEIVRDVVEARAELHRAAGEREAAAGPPEESTSPPSTLGEEEETIKALDE